MPINFPASPITNDTYALGSRTWKYNGYSWELLPLTAGFTGSQGNTGFTGSIGYVGSKGDTGFTGSASTIVGYTGSQGDIGFTGSAGTNGFTGSKGDTGFTGSASTVAGFTGSKGDTGFTGSSGSSGSSIWEEKTSSFNALTTYGYFVDTTSAAITATLPASPTIGDAISFIDAAGTFDTNNLTVGRNGKNIQGLAENLIVSIERAGFTLVFFNNTQGWLLKDK